MNELNYCRNAAKSNFAGQCHHFVSAQCNLGQFAEAIAELQLVSRLGQEKEMRTLRLYIAVEDLEQAASVRSMLAARMSGVTNRTEVVVHPPMASQIHICAWLVGTADGEAAIYEGSQQPSERLSWHYSAISSYNVIDSEVATVFSQQFTDQVDRSRDISHQIGHLLRTWIYIGDITRGPHEATRYQLVNAARKAVFQEYRVGIEQRVAKFPASTGIGTPGEALHLGYLSCKIESPDLRVVSLENRQQNSAFHYPQQESHIAPLFSRAIAILGAAEAMIFISGTASILGSKSTNLGDVREQTRQTIANISTLLCARLLSDYDCYPPNTGLQTIESYTVYVKFRTDFEIVKEVCDSILPRHAVATYVEADVCRSELLVEIEAIAVMAEC
ncbi:Rid family hydrolase [Pseudomonas graminis]|uniref:chorismate transformation enzyme, FkbO/Hyg5 family n=1 Tax=Pseudomonas graminis TaxID=158627 RepID=UPI00234BA132|nr:Rid family hydrolase [Pseudomonas graminis]MDC6382021.1 Rid family hydrolase [Pseudomonas graminis]